MFVVGDLLGHCLLKFDGCCDDTSPHALKVICQLLCHLICFLKVSVAHEWSSNVAKVLLGQNKMLLEVLPSVLDLWTDAP